MTEEKKEAKEEAPQNPPPAAEVAAPASDAAASAPAQPPAQEQPGKKKVKKEKPSNCAGCNKSIRKKRWYYRNGKFFCTKRCWHDAVKKEKAKAAEGQEKK